MLRHEINRLIIQHVFDHRPNGSKVPLAIPLSDWKQLHDELKEEVKDHPVYEGYLCVDPAILDLGYQHFLYCGVPIIIKEAA